MKGLIGFGNDDIGPESPSRWSPPWFAFGIGAVVVVGMWLMSGATR